MRRSWVSVRNNEWLSSLRSSTLFRLPNDVSKLDLAQVSFLPAERSQMSCLFRRGAHQVRDEFNQIGYQSPMQLASCSGMKMGGSSYARSFSSKTNETNEKNKSEAEKEISTVEDPFDAPTYNIPEKPVTFMEGASYTLVILAGLGIAAAAAYGVFKELIFEPKEYKIFNKALKRVQDDGHVRVRIGTPITGYGSESRNRAARQRIPHKVWNDEDGIEHVLVNFYVRGPHGAGHVSAEMFKDKVEREWKFMYLIVELTSPSKAQFILESYVPA